MGGDNLINRKTGGSEAPYHLPCTHSITRESTCQARCAAGPSSSTCSCSSPCSSCPSCSPSAPEVSPHDFSDPHACRFLGEASCLPGVAEGHVQSQGIRGVRIRRSEDAAEDADVLHYHSEGARAGEPVGARNSKQRAAGYRSRWVG